MVKGHICQQRGMFRFNRQNYEVVANYSISNEIVVG